MRRKRLPEEGREPERSSVGHVYGEDLETGGTLEVESKTGGDVVISRARAKDDIRLTTRPPQDTGSQGSSALAQGATENMYLHLSEVDVGRDLFISQGYSAEEVLRILAAAHDERLRELSERLQIQEQALAAFFLVLRSHAVPPQQLMEKLLEFAVEHRELRARLEARDSALEARPLFDLARRSIENGDHEQAEQLLQQAEEIEMLAERRALQELQNRRFRSVDARKERGAVALMQLDYRKASALFGTAAASATDHSQRVDCLQRQVWALFRQGNERGDMAALHEALPVCRMLLELHPRSLTPLQWADAQVGLGNVLTVLGERESGNGSLESASMAYDAALEVLSHHSDLTRWASAQRSLGNCLRILGQREAGDQLLKRAADAYQAALEKWPRESAPFQWATTTINLGAVLATIGERDADSGYLATAIAAYEAALQEGSVHQDATVLSLVQNNLGCALRALGQRESRTDLLDRAEETLRKAVSNAPRDRMPLSWATAQCNLGSVLVELGRRRSNPAQLQTAKHVYEVASAELTPERAPLDWAMIQNNLGNALLAIGYLTADAKSTMEAVAAYRAALGQRVRHCVPLDWATSQLSLGTALLILGVMTEEVLQLEDALIALQSALEELTRERAPLQWALAWNNIGLVFWALEKDDEALAAFRNALKERTRERVPLDWAATQFNVANALGRAGVQACGTELLDEAIAGYEAALSEWTHDRVPSHWAMARNRLDYVREVLRFRLSHQITLDWTW